MVTLQCDHLFPWLQVWLPSNVITCFPGYRHDYPKMWSPVSLVTGLITFQCDHLFPWLQAWLPSNVITCFPSYRHDYPPMWSPGSLDTGMIAPKYDYLFHTCLQSKTHHIHILYPGQLLVHCLNNRELESEVTKTWEMMQRTTDLLYMCLCIYPSYIGLV